MLVFQPKIFSGHQGVLCGVSSKVGQNRTAPYFFNLSYSVNDDPDNVKCNREKFFSSFGLKEENVAFQKQIHSDNISIPSSGGNCGESDAMITDKRNLALAISTADCTPVFIYDPGKKVIAGIHSGWRSAEKGITTKVIERMKTEFNCVPAEMIAYIGPSICGSCYEVGSEFKTKFEERYLTPHGEKYKLNLPLKNFDLLIRAGIKKEHIQYSNKCTFEMKDMLHSFRRDGAHSGRALGLIVMKD